MLGIPIIYKINNLEILTKLLNSVAKKYGCRVEYMAEEDRIQFIGDMECCRYVTEKTLALFPKSFEAAKLPLRCNQDGAIDNIKVDERI